MWERKHERPDQHDPDSNFPTPSLHRLAIHSVGKAVDLLLHVFEGGEEDGVDDACARHGYSETCRISKALAEILKIAEVLRGKRSLPRYILRLKNWIFGMLTGWPLAFERQLR